MRSQHRFGVALLLLGAFVLSGCGMFGGGREQKRLVCPGSFVAPEIDKLAVFKPGTERRIENVLYGVQIAGINSRCERGEKGIVVSSRIEFRIIDNDPSARTGSFAYFVSVVDAEQNILTKQVYTIAFELDSRQGSMTKREELTERLPLLDVSTGGNYAVVVGLQLTPEQVEFNRAASRPPTQAPLPPVPPANPVPAKSPPPKT